MANLALKVARKSNCRQQHGAVVLKGGRVISTAYNIDKNNPNILEEEKIRMHSSICAERRALKGIADPKGAVIIVVRAKSSGMVYSKPCDRCRRACQSAGIKAIIYS